MLGVMIQDAFIVHSHTEHLRRVVLLCSGGEGGATDTPSQAFTSRGCSHPSKEHTSHGLAGSGHSPWHAAQMDFPLPGGCPVPVALVVSPAGTLAACTRQHCFRVSQQAASMGRNCRLCAAAWQHRANSSLAWLLA